MKKNYLIFIGIFLILLGSIMTLLTFNNKKKNNLTTITIDINPSIELTIDENEVVTSIKA